MTPDSPGKVVLVALNCGLSPHAEPLVCDDLCGTRSIFGRASCLPRPIKNWQPDMHCDPQASVRATQYEESVVLWKNKDIADLLGRATRIASGEQPEALDVPASTFIAGKSTSSFALAWDLFEDGILTEWGGVICACQREGRGQLRRHWHSPRGNLHVTFLLPQEPLLTGDAAALVTGYILLTALRALGFPLSLKWPNDLLLNESDKVGGILLEERKGVLMAGLGINLAEAPAPTELREQGATRASVLLPEHAVPPFHGTGQGHKDKDQEPLVPFLLWRRLVSEAILTYIRNVQGRSLPELLDEINGVLAWKNRTVLLMEGSKVALHGSFLGLGPGGGLLLQLPHGERREVFSGSLCLGSEFGGALPLQTSPQGG